MPPLISILLPVYNAKETLDRAITSLIRQSFTDWECIAVDDGSNDGTGFLLRQWADEESRLKVIHHRHSGIAATLNIGLDAAQGTWIARMDADDESLPHRFSRQVDFLRAHPEVGVISCLVEYVSSTTIQQGFSLYVDWTNSLRSSSDHSLNRFVESPVIHPTVLFRKEFIRKWGGYAHEHSWPEDYELWLRWIHEGVLFAKIPEVQYRWYVP